MMLRRGKFYRLTGGGIALACAALLASAAFFVVAEPALAQSATAAQPSTTSASATARQKQRAAKAKKKAATTSAKPKASAAKPAPKGFIETIMEGPKLTTTPPPAADWVRASRPDPNAPRAAARPSAPGRAVLTGDQIRANEAQLEALRARHDRIAGRKPQTGKVGSAAGKPQAPEAEKYKPGCVVTCATPIAVPRTQRR